jgi:hypothetical protein
MQSTQPILLENLDKGFFNQKELKINQIPPELIFYINNKNFN